MLSKNYKTAACFAIGAIVFTVVLIVVAVLKTVSQESMSSTPSILQ